MSVDVAKNDAQVDAKEVVEYYGSSSLDQGDEAGLLQRYGVKASDAEGTSESTVFGRSEMLNGPVSMFMSSLTPSHTW